MTKTRLLASVNPQPGILAKQTWRTHLDTLEVFKNYEIFKGALKHIEGDLHKISSHSEFK